jgi:hypothetical protein
MNRTILNFTGCPVVPTVIVGATAAITATPRWIAFGNVSYWRCNGEVTMSEGDQITARYSGEVRFDYYQFYIADGASDPDAALATAWDDPETLIRRLAVGPDFIMGVSAYPPKSALSCA